MILEDFNIKVKHIKAPNLIWNKILLKWCVTSPELLLMLLELIQARDGVSMYHKHLHSPLNPASQKVYMALLDREAAAQKPLRSKCNVFCILHKGYSLN